MRSIFAALSFAASALALAVTYPSPGQGWPSTGSQEVKWVKTAATDPQNFTIVLTGPATALPNGPLVLIALAPAPDASGSTTVLPPATGWPLGDGFRLQLAKSASELNDVITTSDGFTIGIDLTSSSSSKSTVAPTTTPIANPTIVTPSKSASTSSSPTDALGHDNSAPALNAHYGLVSLLAILGFALA